MINMPSSAGAVQAPVIPSSSTAPSADSDIYLPLLVNQFPTIPTAPVLETISNADEDGSYTVSWSSVTGAETYLLQEDDNSAFTSPTTAYEGPGTSKVISGKEVGTYYYRVMASNDYASSEWSNLQSVAVSASTSPCPQTGSWRGNTSQGRVISYGVESSPQCQIAPGSLRINFQTACGSVTVQTGPDISFPIIDDSFSTGIIAGKVQVQGTFTSSDTAEGTFSVNYSDPTQPYYCQTSGTWEAYLIVGANGPVFAFASQPTDDKILVGGDFTQVGGQPHENLARLNFDGSLDATFNPSFNDYTKALAVQTDGKILVGGNFTQVNGQVHDSLARLNADGSLDTGFNTQISGTVYAVALQSDGKIVVGGLFSSVNGQDRRMLVRLNADGTLDTSFTRTESYPVNALAVQPDDDKIWVGGNDTFVRLNADGSLDISLYINWSVRALALQPDGKIIAAGFWNIARFTASGSPDGDFTAPEPNANVNSLGLQSDGRIAVGGYFYKLDSQEIKYLAQLNANGSLNLSYNPGPNGFIHALLAQPENKILVGGEFSLINGQVRNNITRLNADGSLDESFNIGP